MIYNCMLRAVFYWSCFKQMVYVDGCKNMIGILDEILNDKLFYLADIGYKEIRQLFLGGFLRYSGYACDKSARQKYIFMVVSLTSDPKIRTFTQENVLISLTCHY